MRVETIRSSMSDIPPGNDPKQYFIGPIAEEQGESLHKHVHNLVTYRGTGDQTKLGYA
jgi:hypothetical protein